MTGLRAGVLCILAQLLASVAPAQTARTSISGMFPKEMNDFGYADVKTARSFPWFEQVQKQLLPARLLAFEQFVTSTALSPDSEMDALYWGQAAIRGAGVQIVGVAAGEFDIPATEDHLKSLQLPSIEYQGFHLYSLGSGQDEGDLLFFLIDSNTAAFGQPAALKRMIDVRTGVADSFLLNDSLFPLVNASGSHALLWAALGATEAQQAVQDFLPEASQFAQISAIRDRLKNLIVQIDAPLSNNDEDSLNVTFQALCGSPNDANLLAAAMQVALMYRRSQGNAGSGPLASIFDQARIAPRGDTLDLHLSVSQQNILAFLLAGIPHN